MNYKKVRSSELKPGDQVWDIDPKFGSAVTKFEFVKESEGGLRFKKLSGPGMYGAGSDGLYWFTDSCSDWYMEEKASRVGFFRRVGLKIKKILKG